MFGYIGLFIKGCLFGIANIIPGVSGGTIAVITGVYEKLLDSINNLFKKFKSSFIFLLIFGLGAVVAVLAGAKGIEWCLDNYLFPTSCLFIGLILGGIPVIYSPVREKLSFKYIIVFIICMAIVIALLYLPKNSSSDLEVMDYIKLGVCGILASAAMIIPGISGMMMFYLFGYYEVIMGALSGLVHTATMLDSFLILLPVGIGIIVGLFTTAKIIGLLLKKFKVGTYYGILGFVVGSVCAIMFNLIHSNIHELLLNNTVSIVLSITFLIVGFALSYIMSKFGKKDSLNL